MSGIIRVHKTRDYSVIANGAMRDSRLSFAARGVLAYLLTKPDNWEVRSADLESQSPAGRDAVRSMLKELEQFGYLSRHHARNKSGRWEWETEVFETSQFDVSKADSPARDSPAPVNPAPEKAAIKEVRIERSTKKRSTEAREALSHNDGSKKQERVSPTPPSRPSDIHLHPLFDAMNQLCRSDYEYLSAARRAKFEAALDSLQSGGCTSKALDAFAERWRYYWRCERNGGRAPQPHEVVECWQEVMNPQPAA